MPVLLFGLKIHDMQGILLNCSRFGRRNAAVMSNTKPHRGTLIHCITVCWIWWVTGVEARSVEAEANLTPLDQEGEAIKTEICVVVFVA